MRIAVVGAGAVGLYFGGRLAAAGQDVVFLARGETTARLRESGIEAVSAEGNFTVARLRAVESAAECGPLDLILVAVKAHQVERVARSMEPMTGPETAVIPLQNGVEAPRQLAAALGPERVLGGLCKIFSTRTAPGRVEQVGFTPLIAFGELGRPNGERVARLRAELEPVAGMKIITPDNIEAAMWEKLLFVEPMGAVGAVTRRPVGVVRSIPQTRALLQAAMEEIVALTIGRGIAVAAGAVERALALADGLPAAATASMQRDLMEGKPSEFEYQTGTVVRYGRQSGVPTPIHNVLYAALLPSASDPG